MKFMRKAHNYLGLILFVQIGLWFLSGLVMAWLPIDEVRGNHLRNRVTTSWHSASVTPSDILRNHGSTAVLSLTHRINEVGLAEPGSLNAIPVYHVVDDNIAYRYSALTGEALQTMQQSAIRKAAKGQYPGTGDIGETQLLSVLPQEVQNLSAPLWQVNFDDDLNSRFYIDPNTGSVLRVR
ncbi:MAG: PepSY domain-containing protein, partial [Alteromonas sp.]